MKIGDLFTCSECDETFPAAREHEEALEEFHQMFPGCRIEDAEIICEDCFVKLIKENGRMN